MTDISKRVSTMAAIGAVWVGGLAIEAQAATVPVFFSSTGTPTLTAGSITLPFNRVIGSFTYDNTAPDLNTSSTSGTGQNGQYRALQTFTLNLLNGSNLVDSSTLTGFGPQNRLSTNPGPLITADSDRVTYGNGSVAKSDHLRVNLFGFGSNASGDFDYIFNTGNASFRLTSARLEVTSDADIFAPTPNNFNQVLSGFDTLWESGLFTSRTLALNFTSTASSPQTFTATFNLTPLEVPEPGALSLAAVGLLGLAGVRLRRTHRPD